MGCIAIKIRYSNFDTHTKQLQMFYTTDDEIIINKALELFDKLYDRRLLIRLVGVRFSKIVSGYSQINLFDNSAEMANLYQSMDRIRVRHGSRLIGRAYGMLLYQKRREKFRRIQTQKTIQQPIIQSLVQ